MTASDEHATDDPKTAPDALSEAVSLAVCVIFAQPVDPSTKTYAAPIVLELSWDAPTTMVRPQTAMVRPNSSPARPLEAVS